MTPYDITAITTFIDGSNVYGSDLDRAEKLRAKKNGKMLTHDLGPTLPTRREAFKIKIN